MSATETASPPATNRARCADLCRYATGSLGMGVWVTVPGLLLLYFLTHTLGVPSFLAGLTLLLPKIVDAVVHPWLGTLSDRRARRTGHRRGMLAFGLLLGIAMTAMFSVPPGLSGGTAALWVGFWFIAGNLLFACFQVPYLTTPSDLDVGYHERTRVFMGNSVDTPRPQAREETDSGGAGRAVRRQGEFGVRQPWRACEHVC